MKFKLLSTAIIMSLILTLLSGCSTQSIDKQFINAVKKTSSIKRASSSINFTIKFDMENSNLSPEEKSLLNAYNNIDVSLVTKNDSEKKISYLEGNTTFNGMSVNFKLYQKDNKTILEVPVLGKYIVLNENSQAAPKPDEATQLGIMELINRAVTKDSIKKSGTDKITIGDKTSDVTGFEISLKDSDIKNILNKAIDLFSSDKQLKSYIVNTIKNNAQETKAGNDTEDIFSSVVNEIKQNINNTKIENFSYKGAFNKNLIIVEEDLSSDLTIQLPESKSLKMNIGFKSSTYDIDKYVDFEMPAVDKYNSITIDDLYKMMDEIK